MPTDAQEEIRTWTMRQGGSQIKATVVALSDGVVSLKTQKGKTIKIAREKLVNEDHDYLRLWKKRGL